MDWLLDDLEGLLPQGRSRNGDDGTSLTLTLQRRTLYNLQKFLRELAKQESHDFFAVRKLVMLHEELRQAVAVAIPQPLAGGKNDCEK